MIKLPKENAKITVGPFTYTLHYSEDTAAESESYGSIHHKSQKIFIDPKATLERQRESFLHELLHAIVYVNGLSFRWDKRDFNKKPTEEDTVREISTSFMQLMKDNPNLF